MILVLRMLSFKPAFHSLLSDDRVLCKNSKEVIMKLLVINKLLTISQHTRSVYKKQLLSLDLNIYNLKF